MKKTIIFSILIITLISICFSKTNNNNIMYRFGRDTPYVQMKNQNESNVWLSVSNYGLFGNGGDWGVVSYSCVYPAFSDQEYLYIGGLWVGAIVNNDTLCSVGVDGWAREFEMFPGVTTDDSIKELSNIISSPIYDTTAVSELDFIAVYVDTYTDQAQIPALGFFHTPLGIQITQKSYSCMIGDSMYIATGSPQFYEDFIIFEFWIKNIGMNTLREMYLGLYIDGDCGPTGALYQYDKSQDDVCGFLPSIPVQYGGNPNNSKDSIRVAWVANAAMIGFGGTCAGIITPGVLGTRVLRSPNPSLSTSFNWWFSNQADPILDWGPTFPDNPYDILLNQINSQFSPGDPQAGTPSYDDPRSDILKWLYLRNGAIDPDQLDIKYPGTVDTLINDTRFLLSFGPIYPALRNGVIVIDSTFQPDDSVCLTVAIIGGENFQIYNDIPLWSNHPFVTAGDTMIPFDTLANGNVVPDYDYSWSAIRYDFTDLGVNAKWAQDIYDNPMVITAVPWGDDTITQSIWSLLAPSDTIICDTLDPYFNWPHPIVIYTDTIDWTGDGIPDYKGPSPIQPPDFLVIPGIPNDGDVSILWGVRNKSINQSKDSLWNLLPDEQIERDIFTPNYIDFQGYRIYKGYLNNNGEISSWTILKQWDRGERLINIIPNNINSQLINIPQKQEYSTGNWLEMDSIRAPNAAYHDSVYQLKYQLLINSDFSQLEEYIENYRYIYVDSNVDMTKEINYSVTSFDFGNPYFNIIPLESEIRKYPKTTEIPKIEHPQVFSYRLLSTNIINENLSLQFTLPVNTYVEFSIYDISGRIVYNEKFNQLNKGDHILKWECQDTNEEIVSSGTYFYQLKTADNSVIGKFLILR